MKERLNTPEAVERFLAEGAELEGDGMLACDPEPFSTVPCGCDECDESGTRLLAHQHPDWRGLANAVGVAQTDMERFLRGEAGLTGPNRKRIREVLS